jgi:hypothetical protein
MEKILPPKRRFNLELHSTKSQKASIIDIAVNASQKTVFFGNKFYIVSILSAMVGRTALRELSFRRALFQTRTGR